MIKHYARQHTLVCTARADDLALPFQSVRLSVCLSVQCRCIVPKQLQILYFQRSATGIILFSTAIAITKFHQSLPCQRKLQLMTVTRGGEIGILDRYCTLSRKRYETVSMIYSIPAVEQYDDTSIPLDAVPALDGQTDRQTERIGKTIWRSVMHMHADAQ